MKTAQLATPPTSLGGSLLTISDLAGRWQLTIERTWRRVRDATGIKAINLGTPKYPELRFRLPSIEAWEARVEQRVGALLQCEGSEAGDDHQTSRETVRARGKVKEADGMDLLDDI